MVFDKTKSGITLCFNGLNCVRILQCFYTFLQTIIGFGTVFFWLRCLLYSFFISNFVKFGDLVENNTYNYLSSIILTEAEVKLNAFERKIPGVSNQILGDLTLWFCMSVIWFGLGQIGEVRAFFIRRRLCLYVGNGIFRKCILCIFSEARRLFGHHTVSREREAAKSKRDS